jgi:hypothetical protein
MDDQLNICRAKAEECERHALTSADLVIKLRYVTLAIEWHELAKKESRYLRVAPQNRVRAARILH